MLKEREQPSQEAGTDGRAKAPASQLFLLPQGADLACLPNSKIEAWALCSDILSCRKYNGSSLCPHTKLKAGPEEALSIYQEKE